MNILSNIIRQRLRTPQARYYEDVTVRDTQGVVVSHLPRTDSRLLLKKLDEDFVRTHPIVRDEVLNLTEISSEKRCKDSLKCSEQFPKEEKRIRVAKDAFLNPNVPLDYESFSNPQRDRVSNSKRDNERTMEQMQRSNNSRTDCTPNSESSYATNEQMSQLPQMTNVLTVILLNT